MTDAEISRRLALAIGWEPHNVTTQWGKGTFAHCFGGIPFVQDGGAAWRIFDYRDPAVIWPIAERFDCFPHKRAGAKGWSAVTEEGWDFGFDFSYADTAAKAVAIAVIKAKGQQ